MSSPTMLRDPMLEAMLSRRAARGSADGLPAAIARSIAVAPHRRAWPDLMPHWRLFPVPAARAWVLLAIASLLAALVGAAVIGSRPIERSMTSAPTPGVLTTFVGGPAGTTPAELRALSEHEAWAANGWGVWHFVDGEWSGPTAPDGLGPDPFPVMAVDLERDRIAIAGRTGVAVLDGGTWTWALRSEVEFPSRSVAFAPDGSLWTFGERTLSSRPIVRMEQLGTDWQSTPVDCPLGGWLLAATADGAIWSGGFGYSGTWGLARYDGARCTAAPGIAADRVDVVELVADARGGLVAVVLGESAIGNWRQSVMRFDGSAWQSIKVDDPVVGWGGDLAVAPSGDVYLLMDGEILSYEITSDTAAWQLLASTGSLAGAQLSVASDGSVWYSGPAGVDRIVPAGT